MKISSDWIIYLFRSFGICEGVHNRKIGQAVSEALASMNCPQNPVGKPIPSPTKVAETELAEYGLHYDIKPENLPELFKKLSEALEFDLD
jgi:hypothetical protein